MGLKNSNNGYLGITPKRKDLMGTTSQFSVLNNMQEDEGDLVEEVAALKAKMNAIVAPTCIAHESKALALPPAA